MPLTPPPPVAAFCRSTTEPQDFATWLVGGEFEYSPVPGQAFEGTLRVLRVGELVVQQADDGAHTMRAAMSAGITALVVPLGSAAAPARVNGKTFGHTEAFLTPPGQEFHGHCETPYRWAALSLPTALIEAWTDLSPLPVRWQGAASVLALPEAAGLRLSLALKAAARLAEAPPEALFAPGCAVGLAASLLESVSEALTGGAALRRLPRAATEAHRVLRLAEAYLHAHLERPVYQEELCAALGVSPRKLYDAFIAAVGLSPLTYLKVRRLTLARQALRAAGDHPVQVKAVALRHGFWHMGHFARDYRALFGHLPSQTRSRA